MTYIPRTFYDDVRPSPKPDVLARAEALLPRVAALEAEVNARRAEPPPLPEPHTPEEAVTDGNAK